MGEMYRECNWDHIPRQNRALLPYHNAFSLHPKHLTVSDQSIANNIDMVEGAERVVDIT